MVFAIGASLVKRNSTPNFGELWLACGVGGHGNVATCQVANKVAGDSSKEIIEKIHMQGLTAVGTGQSLWYAMD